jgi:phosphate transport system substrate-binding protein
MNLKNNYLILGIIVVVVIAVVIGYSVLSGASTITIAGSTSVAPVTQALANAYMNNHHDVKITVSGGDSGVGINDVRLGRVDIGTSSRDLTISEAQGLSQYLIGLDALSIIVNPSNPVNDLSLDQVAGIYTDKITNWSQVGESNGNIVPYTRETGSGTRADFDKFMNIRSYGTNVQVSTFNYGLLQSVVVTPGAIGYIAHYYVINEVKVLSVNNITPTQQTVQNGSYPLTRNLIFLTKGTLTGNIKDFINFCQSTEGQAIVNNTEWNNSNNTIYNPTSGIGPSGG